MSGTRSKRGGQDEDSDVEVPPRPMKMSGDEDDRRPLMLSPGGTTLHGLNGLRSRHGGDKPAELFRKDLISAMKLADTDSLSDEDFYLISDPWRQEWERGVQVPVNPDNIPVANGKVMEDNSQQYGGYAFKHPRKLMHAMQDDGFKRDIHELHEMHKLAEQVCRYDLDDQDVHWLVSVNDERNMCGDLPIEEWQMEKIMEELESQCHSNMQAMIKTVEGLGIEYDENIVCDVCRSPDSEDSNEMVFCDQCDICVHQACYGVMSIPEGNWLCRICTLGIRPPCVLCPKTGGAMKSTKSGSKWAHVSCSLWIPEVSIGCPEKMEPITRISHIPSSRWSLICSQCRERTGACIQCSVKTCKTAFHVTCAFQHGLEMKTILEEDDEEIQLKAYCAKHTKKRAEADGGTPRKDPFLTSTGAPKKECELTEEEKTELRSHRLKKLAEEFYTCVKVPEVAKVAQMDEENVDFIYNYWLLKRKSNFNKPLLNPKTEEEDLLSKQQQDCLIARMRMFVHLRQDLERVRNLCYMVTKREKVTRTMNRLKEEVFRRQVLLLNEERPGSEPRDLKAIATAHKSSGQLYDDYDHIFQAAQDCCGGQPLITEPIDHKLDAVRPWKPGRPKVAGGMRRDSAVDPNSKGSTGRSGAGRRPHHHQRSKSKDLLHSRLHRHNRKSRLDHDKEQVDPRKVNTAEVIPPPHTDQNWPASQDKVERRSLINRRRLSDSNIARQKQRLGKYEKRTSLGRGRTQQKRLSAGLTPNAKDANNEVVHVKDIEAIDSMATRVVLVVEKCDNLVKQSLSDAKVVDVEVKNTKPSVTVDANKGTPCHNLGDEKTAKTPITEDVNKAIPNRKLVVVQSIRERVQSRLHKSLPVNGLQDQTVHKIGNYFKVMQQSGLVDPVKPSREQVALLEKNVKATVVLDKETVKNESKRFKDGIFGTENGSGDLSSSGKMLTDCTKEDEEKKENPLKRTAKEMSECPGTPEMRSSKQKKIESDHESTSNISDKPSETVDSGVSVRSSRDTTPERESVCSTRRSSRRGSDIQRPAPQKQVPVDQDVLVHKKQLLQADATTDQTAQAGGDTNNEHADTEGSNAPSVRTRRSAAAAAAAVAAGDATETGSVDSITSSGSKGSKYSTRLRINLEQLTTTPKTQHS